ncbi:cytochrome P450 [Bimuria novae-zelandiae CBS 107.79]|uniref:Cytochrome P450 n=1 Tax=Bimuria novae-zelandiae CBS 107.79 TaxID=1447943 RepID=A0A6A5VBV0_9PLEO|nr:cytochrome P450 [Bimuria novae-zelandiae CBS 107.79]
MAEPGIWQQRLVEKRFAGGTLSPLDLILFLLSTLLIWLFLRKAHHATRGPLSAIPGPRLCAWTDLPQGYWKITGRDHEIMTNLHEKYGPVVRIGPKHLSYIGTAEIWADIYGERVGYAKCLPKDKMLYDLIEDCFGWKDSLVTAPDELVIRKLVVSSFSPRMNNHFEPRFKGWTKKMVERLVPKAERAEIMDLSKAFQCLSVDLQTDMILSVDAESLKTLDYPPTKIVVNGSLQGAALAHALRLFSPTIGRAVQKTIVNIPHLRRLLDNFASTLSKRIDARLANPPPTGDVLTEVLRKTDLSPVPISKEQFYSTAKILTVAGPEAMTAAMNTIGYHLFRAPSTFQTLVSQIRTRFPTQEDLSLKALSEMDLLTAVIKEGHRLYPLPPGILPRCTPKEGAWVQGVWIPPHTVLGVHQWATYRSESNFHDANGYHPERWMGDPKFKNDRLDCVQVFSAGARRCPAELFSWCVIRLVFASLLLNFDIELADEACDWPQQKSYFIWRTRPLMCRIRPAEKKAVVA